MFNESQSDHLYAIHHNKLPLSGVLISKFQKSQYGSTDNALSSDGQSSRFLPVSNI